MYAAGRPHVGTRRRESREKMTQDVTASTHETPRKTPETSPAAGARRTRSVAKGAAANVAGRIWLIGLNLAVVPVYLHLLGVEAYGLVGVLGSFQALVAVMDVGLGPTLARALARRAGDDAPESAEQIRDWVKTVSLIVATTSVGFALVVGLAGRWLARHWLNVGTLDLHAVTIAVSLMGGVVASQFFASLCTSGVQALERQGLANIVNSTAVTLRAAASIVAMLALGRTVLVFFAAQGIVTFLHALAAHGALRAVLPPSRRSGRFDVALLRSEWRFALGSSGISLISIAITQMDKLVVTRFFPLGEFGYYSVASALAGATPILVAPIAQACYPRFCAMHARGEEDSLRTFYGMASQWITVALAGPAATVVIFATDVLFAWTGNRDVARHATPVAVLLSLGFFFNAAMNAPYSLYLAYGKTRLFIVANGIATMLLVPTMILLVPRLGAVGAALGWLAYSGVCLVVVAPLAHAVTLPSETWRWSLRDVLLPAVPAFAAGLLVRAACGWEPGPSRIIGFGRAALGFFVATAAALLSARQARASAMPIVAARLARPARHRA